jgi:hypothetical protein
MLSSLSPLLSTPPGCRHPPGTQPGSYYLGTYLCLSIASISPTRARSSTLGPCSDHSTRRPAWFARSMARGGWRTGPRTAVDRQFLFLLFLPSGPPPGTHTLSQHSILRVCRPARGNGLLCICLFHATLPTSATRHPAEQGPSRLHPHIVALFAAPKRPCHMTRHDMT